MNENIHHYITQNKLITFIYYQSRNPWTITSGIQVYWTVLYYNNSLINKQKTTATTMHKKRCLIKYSVCNMSVNIIKIFW